MVFGDQSAILSGQPRHLYMLSNGGIWDMVTAHIPINGCTTSPDIGPARNTIATADFVNPSDIRYGVPNEVLV